MTAVMRSRKASNVSPLPASYLGRVSKDQILVAVTEGVSKEAAGQIATLKKDAMAIRAAKLLTGKDWLPTILRAA